MKVLFVMRHSGYVRNFESTLRMLGERGHAVHLAFQGRTKYEQLDPTQIAQQLADRYPTFSYGQAPLRIDGWGLLGREVRLGRDYLRYLGPEYRDAPKLRKRATADAPRWVIARSDGGLLGTAVGRAILSASLRAIDDTIPLDADIARFIEQARPDVLAVTPLVEPGSPQVEYVRSARALGIPTALCVASWDNLTNKGLIHGPLDLVAVWNDAMKDEAVRFHGIPADRVVVTGAAAFDHWFDWRPSSTREAFCARVGLRSDRPYLLYLCSSRFIAPDEVPFVHRWAEQIRASRGALRDAGILVRPHPQNADQWRGIDMSGLQNLTIWPRAGSAPVDIESRSEYFDSMHHSAAVVGLNTTAEIESAIVGRPVFTVLSPEFRDTQEGTLHFRHLRDVNGGLVHVARDFAEHVAQLERALQSSTDEADRCRRFVQAFVRPHGVDVAATSRLADALEALAAKRGAVGWHAPLWAPLVRAGLSRRAMTLAAEARSDRQSYAARLAAKTTRVAKHRSRTTDSPRRATPAGGDVVRQQRLERAVADFRKMGEVDRREFVRTVTDDVPFSSLLDLRGALKPQRLDYDQADIYLHVTNKTETFRVKACAKEPFTIEWMQTHIKRGDVLFDIGANVGAYSLVAARKPGGGARVYAFEASYANVAALCANIALNNAADDVTPVPVALSGETAMGVFNLRDLDAGSARHGLGAQMPENGQVVLRQPVMTFRLDDLIDRFTLPAPNHIKMDVDGGELDVLAGACRTLSSPSLRSMLVEVAMGSSAAVTQAIERHGLSLASRFTVTNRAGEQAVWYGLFERQG
ncbi:MAG TPA: FkbM family methyltransferase [Vicinamibacterales bacterium]|jgi:FkbM family methyltransferase|nr:FkbM family methyltransferase [Vicinamibacterales bacterium]